MKIQLGDIIASGIEFKDTNQKKMAEDLGIQYSTFNNYVCNTRQPDFDTMIKIFTYLDIDLNEVFKVSNHSENYKITKDEAHLLRLYRESEEEMKKRFIAIVENLYNYPHKKQ